LDLGESTALPKVRLIHTARIHPGARYTTLSHCWGDGRYVKLNSTNIESMQQDISDLWLRKTYLDAITITRRLSIKYLWINSLCILQDSREDGQRESALIMTVYSNSFLNISATAASDGDGGCFIDKNPL
jgi:hypothetical protein